MQKQTFNIYCDESCHLESDGACAMVLGAIWCPLREASMIASEIREIKVKHDLPPWFEIKWTKVTPSKVDFYLSLIDYFFQQGNLHFRALVADKTNLRHGDFGQDHDQWYYKMYFDMLKVLFSPSSRYHIYIDIKDSRGGPKVRKLKEVLGNANYDFCRDIIERVQIVRSHEIEQLQLADLLVGCVGYANRKLETSEAKLAILEQVRRKSGYDLMRPTLLREQKVNIFHWCGKEV
ncbi:DUF3800 domain-containing protein [Bythopirellula goksoeyrii]|nr:DUF3800 domain-containing protein [Bythopirellula goksoeyrii]